jgi:short subunit dehydrogenase-like uncharacterized protein
MRNYDLVLFGATGFTGTLLAEYFAAHGKSLRWAIAGRSKDKLEAVKAKLGLDVPVLVADSFDEAALEALVPQTRVVCTTVGPYAKYGKKLAHACARHGTHYCDITGEVPFVRASIDDNHDLARESRARIVHCCGFDSIPFDLGVHMLWARAHERGETLAWAKGFAGKSRGKFSGGTVASMLNLFEDASRDRGVLHLMANPYALDPARGKKGPDGPDQLGVRFDRDLGSWTGPFLMAAVNTRVVRRSNALLDHAYGEDFRYSEAMSFGKGARGAMMAAGIAAGLGASVAAASSTPLRRFLAERLPQPGEGPTKEERDNGFFEVHLIGETEPGRARLRGFVKGTSDPGYGETAKMLGESALCLAEDEDALPKRYGVLTPASSMGMRLVERLRAAGMTWDVR